ILLSDKASLVEGGEVHTMSLAGERSAEGDELKRIGYEVQTAPMHTAKWRLDSSTPGPHKIATRVKRHPRTPPSDTREAGSPSRVRHGGCEASPIPTSAPTAHQRAVVHNGSSTAATASVQRMADAL